ncbi:MAG: hypothetical protein KF864_00560 [Phycisphaeraceae bacterium]|nr:hypothetical protein [Phycisphaeraceae bacterium]
MPDAPSTTPKHATKAVTLMRVWLDDLSEQERHAEAIGPPPPCPEIDPLHFFVRRHAAWHRRALEDLSTRLPLHWLRFLALPPHKAHSTLVRMGTLTAATVARGMDALRATQWLAPLGPELGRSAGEAIASGTLPAVSGRLVAGWRELIDELSATHRGASLARWAALCVLSQPLRALWPAHLAPPADRAGVAASILSAPCSHKASHHSGPFVAWMLSSLVHDCPAQDSHRPEVLGA